MNKIEINNSLATLKWETRKFGEDLFQSQKEDLVMYSKYSLRINETLTRLLLFSSLQKDGEEAIRESMEIAELQGKRVSSIFIETLEVVKKIKTYNLLNFFVALRLYERKRKKIRHKYNILYRELCQLQKRYGELNDTVKNKRDSFSKRVKEEIFSDNLYIEECKSSIDLREVSFGEQIRLWFTFYRMKKTDFLSLITVEKRKYFVDGEPNHTNMTIEKVPGEIDYEAFQQAVFVEKIEQDNDSYLFDQFMSEVMEYMDRNPGGMSNMFKELFENVPTYNVSTDEFGRLTEVRPTKPALKLVSNKREGEKS
ncbi:hypothetical protein [Brevibacillus laterosporus]|uniref:Uncharacterized protein n=1 Tax=Brevibacillus laterosporus TaxID=1465 RepID=A0A0F7EHF3_BRELA|nr:hypothetical protein EX87_14345 [Brevibacillus laterosporus]